MGTELTIFYAETLAHTLDLHCIFLRVRGNLTTAFLKQGKKHFNCNLILPELINQGMLLQMPMLSRATFDDDNPTPGYIYQEINSILFRLCYISKVNCVVLKNICTVPPLTTLETRRKDFWDL